MNDTTKGLGAYIRQLREQRSLSQAQLAKRMEEYRERKIVQSAIAQFELDKVFPEFETAKALAAALEVDLWEILLRSFYSRMLRSEQALSDEEISLRDARFELMLAALRRFPRIGNVESNRLEYQQLLVKAKLVRESEMTGLQGSAIWQMYFKDLEEFWVCNLQPLEIVNKRIKTAVRFNLRRRNVRYVYFLYEKDLGPGGALETFRLSSGISEELFSSNVRIVPLTGDEDRIRKLRLDFVVANPHLLSQRKAVGFENVRSQKGRLQYSFRMDDNSLESRVTNLTKLAEEKGILIGPSGRSK